MVFNNHASKQASNGNNNSNSNKDNKVHKEEMNHLWILMIQFRFDDKTNPAEAGFLLCYRVAVNSELFRSVTCTHATVREPVCSSPVIVVWFYLSNTGAGCPCETVRVNAAEELVIPPREYCCGVHIGVVP